ncbi:MAG: SDR family NAD(P)-dependent oxidoreductase [Oscillospiraceae bacterium]|nr:SDR family NAD(P)-dependent oxidoreductase [Oscillospiraceae bacterium]
MRALITGGSGTVGAALVREFARDHEVIFTYLNNSERASRLEKEVGARAVKCDVTDRDTIFKITSEYPYFDFLINNAGIWQFKLFSDITTYEWEKMLAVNLSGAFNFTQAVLPAMLRRKKGTIVNISSLWGEVGASCEVHYSAAKAGLIGFSKALAKEVEPSGVRVFHISPGAIEGSMNADFSKDELQDACPDGKILTPTDIAAWVRSFI